MEIINLTNIHTLQIEMTSFCNSFCGACIRNINGGPVNPKLHLEHMSWNVWKKICDACVKYNIQRIVFNGNVGDVSNHPDLIQMLEYLYSKKNNIKLVIHTNGGARSTEFWKDLSLVTKKFPNSYGIFSIDGLEDTNHIYRRGVDFKKIIKNAESFINEGGTAMWRMIVFDHNLHQIEQAMTLSKKMNFSAFILNCSYVEKIDLDNYKNMPRGVITAPSKKIVDELKRIYDWHKPNVFYDQFFTKLKNKCPWQKDRRIQINQEGDIWPCCYFNMYIVKHRSIMTDWFQEKIEKYEKNFNNLNYYSFEEIIMHKFFQEDLLKNFENREFSYCISKCNI